MDISGQVLQIVGDRLSVSYRRFAPGFRDRILARNTRTAQAMQAHNANFIGGEIGGGANALFQTIARPVLTLASYATSEKQIFLCSSSIPPGGRRPWDGDYWAARLRPTTAYTKTPKAGR